MNNKLFIILFFPIFALSCTNSESEKKSPTSDKKDSTELKSDSALGSNEEIPKKDTLSYELLNVSDWNAEDFMVSKKDKSNVSAKNLMNYQKEEWKNVKNPIIAIYQGSDFGDYFHLTFTDSLGKNYDFGFGNNDLGDFKLYDEPDFNDHPKWLKKKFKIYWNWKISSFPCCDGEYEKVEAYMPSIVRLEIIPGK